MEKESKNEKESKKKNNRKNPRESYETLPLHTAATKTLLPFSGSLDKFMKKKPTDGYTETTYSLWIIEGLGKYEK